LWVDPAAVGQWLADARQWDTVRRHAVALTQAAGATALPERLVPAAMRQACERALPRGSWPPPLPQTGGLAAAADAHAAQLHGLVLAMLTASSGEAAAMHLAQQLPFLQRVDDQLCTWLAGHAPSGSDLAHFIAALDRVAATWSLVITRARQCGKLHAAMQAHAASQSGACSRLRMAIVHALPRRASSLQPPPPPPTWMWSYAVRSNDAEHRDWLAQRRSWGDALAPLAPRDRAAVLRALARSTCLMSLLVPPALPPPPPRDVAGSSSDVATVVDAAPLADDLASERAWVDTEGDGSDGGGDWEAGDLYAGGHAGDAGSPHVESAPLPPAAPASLRLHSRLLLGGGHWVAPAAGARPAPPLAASDSALQASAHGGGWGWGQGGRGDSQSVRRAVCSQTTACASAVCTLHPPCCPASPVMCARFALRGYQHARHLARSGFTTWSAPWRLASPAGGGCTHPPSGSCWQPTRPWATACRRNSRGAQPQVQARPTRRLTPPGLEGARS
jgi:hypothetical protein